MKKIEMKKATQTRTLEEGFNEFIKFCQIKNLSEKSISYYNIYFNMFKSYLDNLSISNIKDIKEDTTYNYILHLKNSNKFKDITINSNLRAIRAILHYFQKLGYCENFKIALLKVDKTMKTTYTDQELQILLQKYL